MRDLRRQRRDVRPRRRPREFPISVQPWMWVDAQGRLCKPFIHAIDNVAYLHHGEWWFVSEQGPMPVERRSAQLTMAYTQWLEHEMERQLREAWADYHAIWGPDAED